MQQFSEALNNVNPKIPKIILQGALWGTITNGQWSYATLWCTNYPDLNTHSRGMPQAKSFEIPEGYVLEILNIGVSISNTSAIPTVLNIGVGYVTGAGLNYQNQTDAPEVFLGADQFRLTSSSAIGLDDAQLQLANRLVNDGQVYENLNCITPYSGFPATDALTSKKDIPDNIASTKVNVVGIVNVGGFVSLDKGCNFFVTAILKKVVA